MWSEEMTQSALPKLPSMDGWHLCWLSTTNSYDSIDKRMRLGYVPVKSDELPGYEETVAELRAELSRLRAHYQDTE